MSTDFVAFCDACRIRTHAGQVMACKPSFGYGSEDSAGRAWVAEFVFKHAPHDGGARIELADVGNRVRAVDDYVEISY